MKRPWLVKQRTDSDCGVCCLAMLTGRRYEDVLETIGDAYSTEDGMTHTPLALMRLGYQSEDDGPERNGFKVFDIEQTDPPMTLGEHILFGRRAIMSVPSLKHQGGWHLVYWTGQQLMDPGNNPPRNVYELEPRTLLLFREAFHM